jgi:transposase
VYPEASLSTSTAYEWFSKFAAGDRNLQDEPRSGRPSCIDDSTLKAILKADPHQTTTDLARKLGCHRTTVANHLHAIETKSSVQIREVDSMRQSKASLQEKQNPA